MSDCSTSMSSGILRYPSARPFVTADSIERPNTAILRPRAIAASVAIRTRFIFEAKVAKIMRPCSILSKMRLTDFATQASDLVHSGRSALVESLIMSKTPFSPMRAIDQRLGGCLVVGVRSNLKSPVSTIVPTGVCTATPNTSGIEWVVRKNSTLILSNSNTEPSVISCNSTRLSSCFSSSLFLMSAMANGPA